MKDTKTEINTYTFNVKTSKGKLQVKMKVDAPLELLFESVEIKLNLTFTNGEIELPIIPKLKDDNGNVYCELSEEADHKLFDFLKNQ